MSDPHSIDLPFEEGPPGQSISLGDDTLIASGMVVMAVGS